MIRVGTGLWENAHAHWTFSPSAETQASLSVQTFLIHLTTCLSSYQSLMPAVRGLIQTEE